ncbi:serpin B [Hathewaya proteolytica DSM 3090]|uniref:Serpin B n=1 Tax=Hathewaya proteolytica DSM 3090 TaxID=1121331 RepID=A0A1M6T965_9CLOT|nr:serpin family protein [Hathewaya proteolytica]SHK53389.1 serpin B [Hathewaya proteolytica DSM 3090]
MNKILGMKKIRAKVISLSVLIVSMVSITGCTASNVKLSCTDLMQDVKREKVESYLDDSKNEAIDKAQMGFAIELLKNTVESGGNAVISPLSASIALAMTSNGADGETKKEIEKVLVGGMDIEDLNKSLYNRYIEGRNNNKKDSLLTANSIWYKESKEISKEFLQKNINYYDSQIYSAPFDESTVKDINKWVKSKTQGDIDKLVEKLSSDTIMCLINAISFRGEWKDKYDKNNLYKGFFNCGSGKKSEVDMMKSNETYYIEDDKATGFAKPYKDGRYKFVALLPNEGVTLQEYISSLEGDRVWESIYNAKSADVEAVMPKFSMDYLTTFKGNNTFKNMGIKSAFSMEEANFSKMNSKGEKNLYIDSVIQKCHITVDEKGTKASAATGVIMKETAMALPEEKKRVILDRPFLYMIVDSSNNLPIFLGTVTEF